MILSIQNSVKAKFFKSISGYPVNLKSKKLLKGIWDYKLTVSLNLAASFLLIACASSTKEGEIGLGRKQLFLMPESQIISMSAESYEQLKKEAQSKNQLDTNVQQTQRVQLIAKKLIPFTSVFREDAPKWAWDVHVITSQELNAFCMPGGKIIFYTGLIEKLNLTDAEIAAVMGHEIAHALRQHGRERMSEELIKQTTLGLLVETGTVNKNTATALMAASAVFISLPHGRGQESEADDVGLELMARAGYNPEEAVTLWQKMGAGGGGKPPEILSTHPSDSTRMNRIRSLLPKVMPLYLKSVKG